MTISDIFDPIKVDNLYFAQHEEEQNQFYQQLKILPGSIVGVLFGMETAATIEKISQEKKLNEIILCLSATPEGEFSARYIEKILEPAQKENGFKITRLGRGLSTGAELEYLNRDTLKNALENRK